MIFASIFNKKETINFLDIGCSSFIPSHFHPYAKSMVYRGFDPDQVGIDLVKPKVLRLGFKDVYFESSALGSSDSEATFFPQDKRTGSFVVVNPGSISTSNSYTVKLKKSSYAQYLFDNNSANLVKIDVEGHEHEILKGLDLSNDSLIAIEVECSIRSNDTYNPIGDLISLLETHNFTIDTFKYHNEQSFALRKPKSNLVKSLLRIAKFIRFNKHKNCWNNLNGQVSFSANKSYLTQIEFLFTRKPSSSGLLPKYYNILAIYGLNRYTMRVNLLPPFIVDLISFWPNR